MIKDTKRSVHSNKRIPLLLLALVILLTCFQSGLVAKEKTYPTLERGAEVFKQRCTLCHGAQGMGEGRIPLKIKNYPDTNIVNTSKAQTKDDIHNTIVYGGLLEGIDKYMPPMGDELTWTEIESVAMFVFALRQDPEKHLAILRAKSDQSVSSSLGRDTYSARCVLCHGKNGLGDGRMSKIIKSPPPFNLTVSAVPAEYIKLIVSKGGKELGRSEQMPPWGDQLSEDEINAVTEYLISIRE